MSFPGSRNKDNDMIMTGVSSGADLPQSHYTPDPLPNNPGRGQESQPHFTGEEAKPVKIIWLAT